MAHGIEIRRRLAAGEVTIGSWLCMGSPAAAEIMAAAGFDWLAIDLEHTAITLREAEQMMRAMEPAGCTPLVRVTSNDRDQIKRVLDIGAGGVIVPMVNSRADAEAALRAVHYPPHGERGVGLGRAHRWGAGFGDYLARFGEECLVVVQVEHRDGVAALEDVLAVPGIQASIIGPYDLSGSLGMPGAFDAPEFVEQLRRYESISRIAGVPMGYHVVTPDARLIAAKAAEGNRFLALSTDFLFLGESARSAINDLRSTAMNEVRSVE
jgi:2-keto-3-deoxy-L-rhamnonate aldolase RhmA